MRKHGFVFQDVGGGRWVRFKILACLGAILAAIGLGLFFRALFVAPALDSPNSLKNLKQQIRAYQKNATLPAGSNKDRVLLKLLAREKPAPKPVGPARGGNAGIKAAFFAGWDEDAIRSLKLHENLLTHLCPEWLSFTDLEEGPQEDSDAALDRIQPPKGLKIMPVLTNLNGSRRIPEAVESLMRADDGKKELFVTKLSGLLKEAGASGVVLDWEEVDAGEDNELSDLVIFIADGLKKMGLKTWLCVTMDSTFAAWDFDRLSPHVDHFVALLHDENGEGDPAGPLASQDWFDGWVEVISHCGEPGQWIASLGSYGSDWEEGSVAGEQISFADAMSRAGNAGCTSVRDDAPTFNGWFSYYYEGKGHDVWFLDAASFANEWNAVRAYGLGGVIVNRLGLEDPAIWKTIGAQTDIAPEMLGRSIEDGETITSIGKGEVVSLDPTTAEGRRSFSRNPEGAISSSYEEPPSHPTLFRMGGDQAENVSLTFDDGPDPEWTPAILDILKAKGVKATFFVVGGEAERYPDIIRRIIAEGHEIGNHSFTHSNLAEEPASIVRLELNATQRLIESLTGRSTTLFRPPYNADSQPTDLEELVPIEIAQSQGYLTVLENIDPRDWQKPGPEELLKLVKADRGKGNIILLHDGGGDRSATLDALPSLIDYLRERGDRILTIGELLGIDEARIMPSVTTEKINFHSFASGIGFQILHLLQDFVRAFLVLGTILVLARTVLVVILSRLHKPPPDQPSFPEPCVSVLIPAFNEEKVIAKTIGSILASDYSGKMEVIVVDDGSSDRTGEAVSATGDPRVRLITQPNQGKAHALQNGVNSTENEILVFVDADTRFEKDAIRHLVAAFHDPAIGAVSGHARVGNLRTFLARCQDLEYVSGFNLDRRAYAAWNCITVAPGAISAIRRSAILAAGGFSYETLAEDTDLTLAIHKAGYRIEYQPKAIAHTEAPETFSTLAKQRFRWAYGTLQCTWKHRDIMFNPRFKALGWFSLPGIWFFQVALVAFSPFIDILFLQSILMGHSGDILPYFLAFLGCDVVLAATAVRMEGLPLRDALRIIPQRFIYRPLLSYVIWKSIVQAVRGAWVGWGKLQRTASISIP
ncbi:MAG: glycosyltransferase [Verrucomicrobiaceae bacterium]|nr:MAG: glycosyltransferase [Verrucomicrobiaceae bacterium]